MCSADISHLSKQARYCSKYLKGWAGGGNPLSQCFLLRQNERQARSRAQRTDPAVIHRWESRGPWPIVQRPATVRQTTFERLRRVCRASTERSIVAADLSREYPSFWVDQNGRGHSRQLGAWERDHRVLDKAADLWLTDEPEKRGAADALAKRVEQLQHERPSHEKWQPETVIDPDEHGDLIDLAERRDLIDLAEAPDPDAVSDRIETAA